MKRLLACAALAAALWPCLSRAVAQDQDGPLLVPAQAAPADDQYGAALRALGEGRLEDATALLRQVLEREPRHAGAWLDLAISQCELGNAREAERLFSGLERHLALPPGIAQVIAHYRATGCSKTAVRRTGAWLLSATRGHDDNVNQGASDPRFSIGTGSSQVEYELDSAYLPKADSFGQLAASYLRPLGDSTDLIVQAYSRRYDRQHTQDSASVLAALQHTWKAGDWRVRGTAALGYVTLDRVFYQRQQQLQARVTPPLKLPPALDLALTANLSRLDYPTRPAYDGNTVELGGILAWRGKRDLAQATLTRLHDASAPARPGGDRQSWFGSVQWSGDVGERLGIEAGLTRQLWRSEAAYSPGLIDAHRLQNTTVAHAAVQWRVLPQTSLVLEWRSTQNRENISLFQYNSRALQLSLRWDNF